MPLNMLQWGYVLLSNMLMHHVDANLVSVADSNAAQIIVNVMVSIVRLKLLFWQVDLQPRVGTSSTGMSRETFISNVARDIGDKIPEPFDTQLLKKSIGVPSPVQVVLLQETDRWNKVWPVICMPQRNISPFCKALAVITY